MSCGSVSWHCGTCPAGTVPDPQDAIESACQFRERPQTIDGSKSFCRVCNERRQRWIECHGECAAAPGAPLMAWTRRPRAHDRACVLMPAFRGSFTRLALLLASLNQRAEDTVPLYVILTDSDEVRDWRNYCSQRHGRAVTPSAVPMLAPHKTLRLVEDLDPGLMSAAKLSAALEGREERSQLQARRNSSAPICRWDGFHARQVIGSLKKLLGASRLAVSGCEVAWVMDSESLPLRRFRFGEAFRHNHTLLVQRNLGRGKAHGNKSVFLRPIQDRQYSTECMALAERIHKLPLSEEVQRLGLREK